MSEIASNVKRVHPEGVSSQTYVFATDTMPPRFAIVDITDRGLGATGPLTEEQLAIEVEREGASDEGFLTKEEQDTYNAPTPFSYTVEIGDIQHEGDYPGGHDRMALNLARFVLGA
jgi:hypothetical protein